jgi:hypothetical protein
MKQLKNLAFAGALVISALCGYVLKRDVSDLRIKNPSILEQKSDHETEFPFDLEFAHAETPNSHKIKILRIFPKKEYADPLSSYKHVWFSIPEIGYSLRIRCSPDEYPSVAMAELKFTSPTDIHNHLALTLGIKHGNDLEIIAAKKLQTR